MELISKYQTLLSVIKQYPLAAVAFSGGVDSTLLCKAAYDAFGTDSLALTVQTPLIPQREITLARKMAETIGIVHKIIEIPEIDPAVKENTPDRCYLCKKIVFTRILTEAKKTGITTIFDGSNLDDMKDYRPGLRALKELQVSSPLKEAGLTKQDIRAISKELHLETWDLPAYACLASRIPYGSALADDKLRMVEEGEEFLHSLGFRQIRLRHHEEIARLEISPEEMPRFLHTEQMTRVSNQLKRLGFTYVCLELEGYQMGSLNKNIDTEEKD